MEEILECLRLCPNRLLDFGPSLPYPEICMACTVEKITIYQQYDGIEYNIVPLQVNEFPRARAEGILYDLKDEDIFQLDADHPHELYLRKRMPVYVPYRDQSGNFMLYYAWVYVGKKEAWVSRIKFDMDHHGCGKYRGKEFQLFDRQISNDPVTHNRFRFLPESHSDPVIGPIPDRIRKHVKKRNRAAMRALYARRFFDDKL